MLTIVLDMFTFFSADLLPAFSPRSSAGFQWISSISGFHSQESGIEGQALAAFMQLQSKKEDLRVGFWRSSEPVETTVVC